nr:PREDICTED: elongation of very long chain fatty acids protein AAEL008004-like [Bemisia tabaci]
MKSLKCFWKPGFASFVIEASCEKPHVFPRTADEAHQLHQFHRGAWYYLITKMLDLLDTVFMVAHKKTPGFLHLYHHSTMLLVVFFGFKYVRPIHTVFPSITNNLAHVFMYTYYLICLFNPGFGQRYKGIKMAITGFQIAQFIGIIIHCVAYNFLCPVQKIIVCVLFFQNSVFLVLFSNFFIKSDLTSDKKTKPEIAASKKKVS